MTKGHSSILLVGGPPLHNGWHPICGSNGVSLQQYPLSSDKEHNISMSLHSSDDLGVHCASSKFMANEKERVIQKEVIFHDNLFNGSVQFFDQLTMVSLYSQK